MNAIRIIAIMGILSGVGIVAGCQNAAPPTSTQPQPSQASDNLTPEGDSLNGPIPYPHWPFDIEQGGGGGKSR